MSKKDAVLSMLDLAEKFISETKQPAKIYDIIDFVFQTKGFDLEDTNKTTQLYLDITQSGKFVFCGEDMWDLKENNLELWDKDGHAFVTDSEAQTEDLEEDLDFTEFHIEDIDLPSELEALDDEELEEIEIDEELLEEKEYLDVEIPLKTTDDDNEDEDIDLEFDEEIYDEEDYNEIMDDYEDMYDKD
jgi:DNA-directed RNA polymerase subunit delta